MSEIIREPILTVENGEERWTFDENHSLADIARWIARNLLMGMIGGRA